MNWRKNDVQDSPGRRTPVGAATAKAFNDRKAFDVIGIRRRELLPLGADALRASHEALGCLHAPADCYVGHAKYSSTFGRDAGRSYLIVRDFRGSLNAIRYCWVSFLTFLRVRPLRESAFRSTASARLPNSSSRWMRCSVAGSRVIAMGEVLAPGRFKLAGSIPTHAMRPHEWGIQSVFVGGPPAMNGAPKMVFCVGHPPRMGHPAMDGAPGTWQVWSRLRSGIGAGNDVPPPGYRFVHNLPNKPLTGY